MKTKVFKRYNEENNSLVEFFKKFLRPSYSQEILNWQYGNEKKSCLIHLEDDEKDGDIIATQGFIFYTLTVNKLNYNSAKSESSFLLADYRGQQLFESIYFQGMDICFERGINLIWGYTALDKVWGKKLSFDVYPVFWESQLVSSSIKAISKSLIQQRSLKNALKHIRKDLQNLVSKTSLFSFKQIDLSKHLSEILSIQETWMNEHPTYVCYPMGEYNLNTRVIENPSIQYDTYLIYDKQSENSIGYFILNTSNEKTIYIVDMIILQTEKINTSVAAICKWIKNTHSCEKIAYLGNIQNPYNKLIFDAFESLGAFSNSLDDMKFVLKDNTSNNQFKNIDNFVMNGLWTEGFKI